MIGDKCDGVIGQVVNHKVRNFHFCLKFVLFGCLDFYANELVLQLTEDWGEVLFSALSRAGGKAFSNMAVGYNNVDVNAANKYGVAVGNTPVSFLLFPRCQFNLYMT